MQKTYSSRKVKTISGNVALITTLIIVTPLCGFLFHCGCDWPWSGLDTKCNFYKPATEHPCPWCASMVTGIFSTGLAIIFGVLTAMSPTVSLANYRSVYEVALRTLVGSTVFALMAILIAGLQNFAIARDFKF